MTTPQEAMLAMLMGQTGMYGSPLVEGALSQLNLVQDIGSTTFDTVFMYNAGLITPEQLLDSIKNATREPVGDPNEYDWESDYNKAKANNNTDMIQGMDAIRAGVATAADVIMGLRKKYGEAAIDGLESWQLDNLNDMKAQLEAFEKKYLNNTFVMQKIDSGEYDYDEATGMVYRPLLGEDARENLRAAGWKGPFADPEFWRVVPDPQTMDEAAKLQQSLAPVFEAYDRDNEVATSRTREAIAKSSPAMKKLLEKSPERAGEVVQTTRRQKEVEDAYNQALVDFAKPKNTSAAGFEDLGIINGLRYEITKENGKKVLRGYDGDGNVKRMAETPESIQYYGNKAKDKPSSKPSKRSEASKAMDYAARQAAYYSAKSTGIQQQERKKKAAEGEAQVQAKLLEAEQKGTVPALQWLSMMPKLAAMAAQPAPEKPKATKPALRTLSDEEINTMSSMIAGGLL